MDEQQKQTVEDSSVFLKLGKVVERFVKGMKETADGALGDIKKIDFKKGFEEMSKDFQDTLGEIFIRSDFSNTLRDRIRIVKNFPKQGVDFLDIQPLLSDPNAFQLACMAMLKSVNMSNIDAIVAIESRGFIFGTAIANMFDKELILVRKKGKLPPPIVSESYTLEYGEDVIEMRPGSGRVLVVDDVLATGGTLKACLNLCNKAGYQVRGISVFIDMIHLHPTGVPFAPVSSVLQMNGE